ncbi:MAG: KilA-N domain-containing protein [Verrucomicrobiae bacterium]|nr:KilA-N domain-containing protein [Verrucomicrobiae bacterium]
MAKINVLSREVTITLLNEEDYICLTDIAKHRNADDPRFIIQNWMRTRSTVEFLGIWELLNNPDFNRVEFEAVRNQSGSNAFVMTPTKWVDLTHAVGVFSKAGRYGGTYAHKDIAFEFASWVSVEFKLYLIKEFQRLKEEERKTLGWDIRRNLAKINYRIHTDAIQMHLIPPELNNKQISIIYANEADVTQLVCLSNLENLNALFIAEGISQQERLKRLNSIAIYQMKLLASDERMNLSGGKK